MMNKSKNQFGLTLIELLIAVTLGLLVLGGIGTVFLSTSSTYRVQEGLARLQENGRFALFKVSEDLRMAGVTGCTGKSNVPSVGSTFRGRPVESLVNNPGGGLPTRAQVATEWTSFGETLPAALAYPIDPRYLIRGHECDAANCSPAQNTVGSDPGVPTALSVAAGDRVPGSDILTVRYLRGEGSPIDNRVPTGGTDSGRVSGTQPIPIPTNGNADPLNLAAGDLAMISDCSAAVIFAPGAVGSNELTHTTANGNVSNALGATFQRDRAARIHNASRNWVTVSYFLEVRNDQANPGRLTSALMREENGVVQELVRGVERLDFRYAIENSDGTVRYLTAAEVNTRAGGAVTCPPSAFPEADLYAAANPGFALPGCLWGGVKAIEVSMLVNTVGDVDVDADSTYRYHIDGTGEVTPSDPVAVSGMPRGRMLRRQFTAVIGMRNQHL